MKPTYKPLTISNIFLSFGLLFLVACQEPVPRRPKKQGKQHFYKEVIRENKMLNSKQKQRIANWIAKDTLHQYIESPNGYWYYFAEKDSLATQYPKLNDIVLVEYKVADLFGNMIYDTQKRAYKVDKEDFIPALQDGIKKMKKGERAVFVIPSYSAYGITGDGDKIGVHQPLLSEVTLLDIKTEENNNDKTD